VLDFDGDQAIGSLVDFRCPPFDRLARGHRESIELQVAGSLGAPFTLNTAIEPQRFRILNRLMEAMTSSGQRFRWQSDPAGGRAPLRFGAEGSECAGNGPAEPAWFPRPYVALRDGADLDEAMRAQSCSRRWRVEFVKDLAEGLRVFAPASGKFVGRVAPNQLCWWEHRHLDFYGIDTDDGPLLIFPVLKGNPVFREAGDPVRAGDELGLAGPELPESWKALKVADRWFRLREAGVDQRLLWFLSRAWLSSQARSHQGQVLYPYDAISVAATRQAGFVRELAGWDVSRASACGLYNEACEAFIPPPLVQRRWNELRRSLPRDVELRLNTGLVRTRRSR
jgi:hypothetical protein